MTDHGTGYVLSVPTPPIGSDYQYNWVNISHGDGFTAEPTGIKGGPDVWYIDFGAPTEPEPPTSTIKVWDGTQWVGGVKVWDGTGWVPFKVWSGTQWVQ